MSYQRRGRSRSLIVGSLAVGMVIVLGLALFGPRTPRVDRQDEGEVSSHLLEAPIPERDPNQRVVISRDQAGGADPFASLQTGRGELEFTNDEGALALRYRWDRSTPLEGGWNEFVNPRGWVYQSEQRLIFVSADEGKFRVAENRQPQAGVLEGNVVVSLFEVDDRTSVYSIDPTTAVPSARFETTSMNFDLVRMEGRTDERIVIRTKDALLAGRGLSLLYNEQAGRVEELEIRQREFIAYRLPRSTPAQADEPVASAGEASSVARSDAGAGLTNDAKSTPDSRSVESLAESTQYRLVLDGEVIIDQGVGDSRIHVTGRELEAFFSIGKSALGGRRAQQMHRSDPVAVSRNFTSAPLPTMRDTVAASLISFTPSSDYWFLGENGAVRDEDVQVTGRGAMTMAPSTNDRVLIDADDVYARLTGMPVRIDSTQGYALGSAIEYEQNEGVVSLVPSASQPLEAGIEGGARLTSSSPFEYNLAQQRGKVRGGGSIVGLEEPPTDESAHPERENDSGGQRVNGLPKGFLVSWVRDFGIEFRRDDERGGLGRIDAATFSGSVHVDDPNGYALDAEQLRIGFMQLEDADDPILDTVTASTDAHLHTTDGSVRGDELFVQFEPDAQGQAVARQMTVTGQGKIVTADGTLESDYIQADLAEPSLALDAAMTRALPGSDSIAMKKLTAQGSVFMKFADGVSAAADRLVADAVTDITTLTGDTVVIGDASMQVIGEYMEVQHLFDPEADRLARVMGPGVLTYWEIEKDESEDTTPMRSPDDIRREIERRLDERGAEAGEDESTSSDQARKEVRVTWTDSLTFNDGIGEAIIAGGVRAESAPSTTERNALTGDWMRLELTGPLDGSTPGVATRSTDPLDTRSDGRRLRKMTMLGQGGNEARLEAVRYSDETHDERALLVAVGAPVLEYFEPIERFQAVGAGWMLVVDAQSRAADNGSRADVQFSGPGETDFQWATDMTLEGARGRITMRDDVVMRHRPIGEPVLRMDCVQLEAVFGHEGNLGVLDMSRREEMDLMTAIATGQVFVKREGRSLWADRMRLDRPENEAVLESSGDSWVTIETVDPASVAYARKAIWNLLDDSIVVEGPRADTPVPMLDSPLR